MTAKKNSIFEKYLDPDVERVQIHSWVPKELWDRAVKIALAEKIIGSAKGKGETAAVLKVALRLMVDHYDEHKR